MGNYSSDQKNARFYGLKLSKTTDAAIIAKLDSVDSVQGYIKNLIKNDIEERTMKRISIDNGANWVEPEEAVAGMDWDAIVNMMDDDIREKVCRELAPCTEVEFLTRYLELSPCDLIIG